jgi:hypothetical protein
MIDDGLASRATCPSHELLTAGPEQLSDRPVEVTVVSNVLKNVCILYF